ncbi:MAG: exo-alpha-sialidase [Phycisphaerae bacterium]|nr:exo-alpha-sialidase [Phycisphaerae bacterium]
MLHLGRFGGVDETRGWLLPVLVIASLAHGAASMAQDPQPKVSDCPPMPTMISVGNAVDVFVGEKGPNPVYRIPAITRAGTHLLAFAEGRASLGDLGTNDLVLSTSEDGGATWSAPRTVLDLSGRSINNPCVVTLHSGEHAGRVLVIVQSYPAGTHENKQATGLDGPGVCRLHVLSSDDAGATWSEPRDVTASMRHPEAPTVASGPGAAIQLRSGAHAGRIIVPFNQGPYGSWTVYTGFSDDGGETWSMGAVAPGGLPAHANEVQVAEVKGGDVVLNARSFHGAKQRLGARSTDGGATWSTLKPIEALPDPCCQAGLLSVAVGPRHVLVYSGCDSTTARTNGTLWISLDEGASWPIKQPLAPGFFAYSAPVDLGDGRVGVLAETDNYKRIRFTPVQLMIPAQ